MHLPVTFFYRTPPQDWNKVQLLSFKEIKFSEESLKYYNYIKSIPQRPKLSNL